MESDCRDALAASARAIDGLRSDRPHQPSTGRMCRISPNHFHWNREKPFCRESRVKFWVCTGGVAPASQARPLSLMRGWPRCGALCSVDDCRSADVGFPSESCRDDRSPMTVETGHKRSSAAYFHAVGVTPRPLAKCEGSAGYSGYRRRPDRSSERQEFTARDLHSVPIKFSHDEAIETLIVGAAIVPQEPERLLIADEEAANTVGTVMDAGGVAAERDVAGEFVNLVAKGETGAPPRLQRRAVCR